MSKRYSARKVKRSAVRWMRATTTYYLNFPTIGASSFTSSVIPIAVNYKRTDFDGAPSASNVANITVKNFHVEFNLPDCNIGESYLCQLAFVLLDKIQEFYLLLFSFLFSPKSITDWLELPRSGSVISRMDSIYGPSIKTSIKFNICSI